MVCEQDSGTDTFQGCSCSREVNPPEEMRSTEEKNASDTGGSGRRRSAASAGNAVAMLEGSFLGLVPKDLR